MFVARGPFKHFIDKLTKITVRRMVLVRSDVEMKHDDILKKNEFYKCFRRDIFLLVPRKFLWLTKVPIMSFWIFFKFHLTTRAKNI